MKLVAFNNNKYLKGQEKTRLYKQNQEMIFDSINTQKERREYLKQKGGPSKGPRGMFLEALEQEGVTVEQAMENTLEQMKGLLEKYLINWMREELVKGNLSEQTMKKVKKYLDSLEQDKIRKNENDAR